MLRINVNKYVLICCFALSLSNVNGDVVLLNVSENDMVLNEAACTASCIMQNATAILSSCYDDCQEANGTVILRQTVSNEKIRLICRESDLLIVEIISQKKHNEETNIQRRSSDQLFVLKLLESNSASPHRIICISDSPMVKIEGLRKNTNYDVTATIVTGSLEYRHLLQMVTFKTLDTDNYTPQTISSDSIKLSFASLENSSMITTVSWEPTSDMSCNYYFLLYATQDEDYSTPFEQHFRKLEPFELYHLTIRTLHFETKYVLDMHGINAKNAYVEGNRSSIEFTTPTCWQILGYDSKQCRPLPLKNIQSTFKMIATDVYQINVTWDLPKNVPDFYDVTLNLYSGRGNFVSQNVSGFKNIAYFPQVNTTELKYDVQIVSFSKAGVTTNPIIDFSFKAIPSDNIANAWVAVTLIILVVSSLSMIFVNIAMGVRRNRLNSAKDILNDIHLRGMIRSHNRDGMEIDPSNIDLHELLGEGAFGMVRRGTLKPRNWEIAVKMLKENATTDDKKCFLTEITIMKSVGQHENILGIVGHSTKLDNNLMLLTEYCSEGNLLDYLRKFREIFSKKQVSYGNHDNTVWNELYDVNNLDKLINQPNCVLKCEYGDSAIQLFVENRCYEMLPSPTNTELGCKPNQNCESNQINPQELIETNQLLTSKDLLNFAKQIATGMEFLASNKIVHRDLAARNVLVCSDKTVKIADFGLSRDIYVDNIYLKSSAGRLPIKWLALESMTDHTYTSQSDVWSYGILLYEIVTLGCTPYPTVPVDCLVEYLKSGNRMPKPPNCSFELYDVMSCCWHHEPEKRPIFADLACKVNSFIQNPEANEFLHIENECSCKTIEVEDLSNTSYMTPL